MAIANKHDPRLKGLEELKKTLAVGEKVIQDILTDLGPCKKDALTDQSWILTGARGAGKTHVLTLLYRKIKADSKLSHHWLPLSFPEELFNVDSLYRFLMVVIDNGLKETGNGEDLKNLKDDYDQIKATNFSGTLKEKNVQKHKQTKALFKILRHLHTSTGKKWILMVENLQELLNRQFSRDEQKHLRSFMHEHPETFIIIGSALTVFDAIENYGKPFYHFFRIRSLDSLDKQGTIRFLRMISEFRNEQDIEPGIQKNRAYIYTFHLLTGGNPRLILFLYELLVDHEELNTALILEKVTELTPYFRDKTTEVSKQRQFIIDSMANEAPAQTVTEIAHHIGGDVKSVSVQCSRMADEGWLRVISIRGPNVKKKETFYTLRDYFYRIWYKLRTGPIDESEVYCMAELAVLLFDQSELKNRLEKRKEIDAPHHVMYEKALELTRNERFMKNLQVLYSESKKAVQAEAQKLMTQIDTLIEKKKWNEAEQTANEMLNYPEIKGVAYFYLGTSNSHLDQQKKAIEFYKKAVEIEPGMHEAWSDMGIAFHCLDQYRKAIESYKKAVEIKPDGHNAWYNMGIAFCGLGQPRKAIESYKKAVEIKPDDHEVWNNMGIAFRCLDQYRKAIESYKKAVEIKPDRHNAWYNMGIAFCGLGQHRKAIESYKKAVEIKPDDHEVWNNMGAAFDDLGQHRKAIESYKKAVEIKPDDHKAWYNMGNAFGGLGQHRKAVESYKKAVEIKPDKHEAWYNMGNAFVRLESYKKAWSAFGNFFQYVPQFPSFTYRLIGKLRQTAEALFSDKEIKEKLMKKEMGIDGQLDNIIRLLLLGKFSTVSEILDSLLETNGPYPETDLKTLLFIMEASLIDAMQQKKSDDEARTIMKYLILFRMKGTPREKLKNWFIRFIYNYLSLSDKESFNLEPIRQLVDCLKQEKIFVSDTIFNVIHALRDPETREAQVWMADPLFAEIVKMLQK